MYLLHYSKNFNIVLSKFTIFCIQIKQLRLKKKKKITRKDYSMIFEKMILNDKQYVAVNF